MYLFALLIIFSVAMATITFGTNDKLRLPYAILWGSFIISSVLMIVHEM